MELSQVHSLASTGWLNLARRRSDAICKFGSSLNTLFKKAKYSSLIFLFCAAGGILYFWKRRKKKEKTSLYLHNQPKYSILEKFIERLSFEEFVEEDMFKFCKTDNHGYYNGPCLEYEHYNFNYTERLNDLSCNLQNCSKFELQPRKTSVKPSERYSEYPISNTNTSTPELSTSSEKLKSQRIKDPHRVGQHFRTDVHGSEGVAEWPVSPVSRSYACDSQCSGLEITRDTSVVSGGMRDLVQNAKQVRILIRLLTARL